VGQPRREAGFALEARGVVLPGAGDELEGRHGRARCRGRARLRRSRPGRGAKAVGTCRDEPRASPRHHRSVGAIPASGARDGAGTSPSRPVPAS
jgi:hypothetical protein